MEDFDPDKFLAEEDSFDPDAFLAEDTEDSSKDLDLRPTSSMGYADVKLAEKVLDKTGAGEAIEKGLDKAGEVLTESELGQKVRKGTRGVATSALSKVPLSRLEKEDLDLMVDKMDRYKEISDPKKTGELPKRMAILADEMGETSRTATANLDKMLDADKAGMSRQEFLEDLRSRVSDSRREPTPERLAEVEKAEKAVQKAQKDLARQQTKQESKLAELERKLEESKQLSKEYKQPSEKTLDAKIMKDEEVKELNRRLDDYRDEMAEYDDPAASKEIRKDMEKVQRQKRKVGENLKDLTNKEKIELKKNKKLAEKYEKQAKDIQEEIKSVKKQGKKDVSVLQRRLKEAQELSKKSALRTGSISEENLKGLQRVEGAVDYTTDLKGKDLAVAKETADKLYNKDGDEVRKKVREIIRERSPRASKAMDTASTAMQDRENIMKQLGISEEIIRDEGVTSTETVLPTGKAPSRELAKAMTVEEGSLGAGKTVKEQLENALRRAGKAELIDDLELNRIAKLAENDATVVEAYLASKGLSPTAMRSVFGGIATKTQELGAKGISAAGKILDTPLGKVAKRVAKGAGKMLPVVSAFADYAEAGDLGIESKLGKLAYTGVEQLNPLPISTGEVYTQLKSAREGYGKEADFREKELEELDKGKPVAISKTLKNRENIEEVIQALDTMGPSGEQYAKDLKRLDSSALDEADYLRRATLLASEPAFRELVRRYMKKAKRGVEDGEEN